MSRHSFEILGFSKENLCNALSNEHSLPVEIINYPKFVYLLGYLEHLEIVTIVVENDYTDIDYLDDYANYYARCFRNYNRHCKRLHFFTMGFTSEEFVGFIYRNAPEEKIQNFKESYNGYIIARPLPYAIIGRSALATYPEENGRRHYTCLKGCNVNLFGFDLSLQSLEYQEQDTVLASCSTVALWSCFHKTNDLFQTPILRPAAITKIANEIVSEYRPVPSQGLSVQQINNVINRNELIPEIIYVEPNKPILPLIYGYLKFGLPVILVVENQEKKLHVVTLTGYSIQNKSHSLPSLVESENNIPYVASRIDKFYAHDDQVGPFSSIEVKPPDEKHLTLYFESSWKDTKNDIYQQFMDPQYFIVPVYNKIRVGCSVIQKGLYKLQPILALIPETKEAEWDLYLTTTTELKKNLITTPLTDKDELDDILFTQHPRFIWRAVLSTQQTKLIEFLADATDMERSFPFYYIIWHDVRYREKILNSLRTLDIETLRKSLTMEGFKFFRKFSGDPTLFSSVGL